MMERAAILEKVRELFEEKFQLDPGRVSEEASLQDDLDLDSIDLFDLFVAFEKESGRNLVLDNPREIHTVNELVTALQKAFADTGRAPAEV